MENQSKSLQKILANNQLNLDKKFEFLVAEISNLFELDPLYKQYKIGIYDISKDEQSYNTFAVVRQIKDHLFDVAIEQKYKDFLPIILLREAYLAFIPKNLIFKDYIHIFINRIVEITIKKELIEQYKKEIRKFIIDSQDFDISSDNMNKFFLYPENRIQFFKVVRDSGALIKNFTFYKFLLEIIKQNPSLFYDNEIIETIYVIKEIFYKKKLFTSLEDYKNLFKRFVASSTISTDLSLRNFVTNLQFLKKISYLSASHYINYQSIDYRVIYIIIRFHADLDRKKILEAIFNFPQLSNYYLSYNTSNMEGFLTLNLPVIYLEDIKKIFFKLKQAGYIDHLMFGEREFYKHTLNLNFLLSKFKNRIPYQDKEYRKKYEMSFSFKFSPYKSESLDPLDIVLLNRIPNFSLTGFSLDKKKILGEIKEELFHIILNKNVLIENLQNLIVEIRENCDLKRNIITFLTKNNQKGIFAVHLKVSRIIELLDAIKTFLEKNKELQLTEVKSLLFKGKIFQDVEKNYLIKEIRKKELFFNKWVKLYYQNPKKFIDKEVKYVLLLKLLSSFMQMKIYSFKQIIDFIKEESSPEFLSQARKNLETLGRIYNSRDLTSEALYQKIQTYLNYKPPVIKPFLLNAISTSHIPQYLPSLILRYNSHTLEKVKKIESYFLRTVTIHFTDFTTRGKMIHFTLFSISLSRFERTILLSLLYRIFQSDLLHFKQCVFSNYYNSPDFDNHYDFEKQKMIYSEDLFLEFQKYLQSLFPSGFPYKSKLTESRDYLNIIWETKYNSFEDLINQINERVQEEKLRFDKVLLNKLTLFYDNLSFKTFKSEIDQEIFQQYIDTLEFIPAYNHFGFSEDILFFTSFDPDKLDLRLLLSNTFTNVEIPCEIQDTLTMKVDFIFPFRNFNDSYLNWYAKSLQNIEFYSYFTIKKIYSLFHFDTNFTSKGWKLNAIAFKSHIQKILFDPAFNDYVYNMKKFDTSEQQTEIFGLNSEEFKMLTKIQNFSIKNLHFNKSLLDIIKILLKKGLIFPTITLKNLDLKEKFCVLLPTVKKEHIPLFLKIFHYFNYGYFYEIEGKYFKYRREEEFFEKELYVEMFLPHCDFPKFKEVLIDLFAYLAYKDYLIINDLVPGDHIIKNVFHEYDPSTYNPFLNLEWNDVDKIWMNEKLFDEGFTPKYPNLNPKYKIE